MNRHQEIEAQIQKIKASRKVAPEKTWIASFVVPKKNGKRYTYYRLMGEHPSGKGSKLVCYLGSKDSKKYKEMVLAIARRNQIKKLERDLARLEKLESVSVNQKRKEPSLTISERTIIRHLQTQLNQVMKELEDLKAWQREFRQKIE